MTTVLQSDGAEIREELEQESRGDVVTFLGASDFRVGKIGAISDSR